MMIPSVIRVGSRRYSVKRVARIDGRDAWGQTSSPESTIRLRDDIPDVLLAEIFLHELIHAVMMERDVEKPDDEHLVSALTSGLTAVLQDIGWMPERVEIEETKEAQP